MTGTFKSVNWSTKAGWMSEISFKSSLAYYFSGGLFVEPFTLTENIP